MYPLKRSLGVLKSFVGNKGRPEVFKACGYSLEEASKVCTKYFALYKYTNTHRLESSREVGINECVVQGGAHRRKVNVIENLNSIYTLCYPIFQRSTQSGGMVIELSSWFMFMVDNGTNALLGNTDANEFKTWLRMRILAHRSTRPLCT